eukprot:1344595-Amphidinium_carterae.4
MLPLDRSTIPHWIQFMIVQNTGFKLAVKVAFTTVKVCDTDRLYAPSMDPFMIELNMDEPRN